MTRYYWCSNCKTVFAWGLDAFGCDPETLEFSCECGQFDKAHEWDHFRKFANLPEVPAKGVRYEFDFREDRP